MFKDPKKGLSWKIETSLSLLYLLTLDMKTKLEFYTLNYYLIRTYKGQLNLCDL